MNHQQGLTLVELLFVLLVILLISLAVFFIYPQVQERIAAHHDQTLLRTLGINLQQTFGPSYSAPAGQWPMQDYYNNTLTKQLNDQGCDPTIPWCLPQLGAVRWPLGINEGLCCGGNPTQTAHEFSIIVSVLTPQDCEALLSGGTATVGAVGVSSVDGNGMASPFNTPLQGGTDVVNFCEAQATDGGIIDSLVLNYTLGGQPF